MCHLYQVMLSRLGGVDEVSDVSPRSGDVVKTGWCR